MNYWRLGCQALYRFLIQRGIIKTLSSPFCLRELSLHGKTWKNLTFRCRDFADGDFSEAIFINCRFSVYEISRVNFKGSVFIECHLDDAGFHDCCFDLSIFSDSLFGEGAVFESCSFKCASFKKTRVFSLSFKDCLFHGMTAQNTRVLGSEFSGCVFDSTVFFECNLGYAQFRDNQFDWTTRFTRTRLLSSRLDWNNPALVHLICRDSGLRMVNSDAFPGFLEELRVRTEPIDWAVWVPESQTDSLKLWALLSMVNAVGADITVCPLPVQLWMAEPLNRIMESIGRP